MQISVAELARLVGGEHEGPGDVMVSGVAGVDDAGDGDVVLAENERFFEKALNSRACCIVADGKSAGELGSKCVVRVSDPGEAFAAVLGVFKPEEALPQVGIAAGAVVDPSAVIGEGVAIGAGCCVCAEANVGDGCVLFPNTYIGKGVRVGSGTKIYPGVTIYDRCSIGRNVVLHAGVVIGSDGFGYRPCTGGLTKLPHIGIVELGDNVEIGANSAVDRAKFGATIIGSGTKIDNLVHIAHNVRIGSNCVVVALSGVAGSAEIGDGVTLAAQTGVKDHVRIEDGSVVAARSGVIGDVKRGSVVSGFPARDHKLQMRAQATLMRLPEILERVRALESELKKLRAEGED